MSNHESRITNHGFFVTGTDTGALQAIADSVGGALAGCDDAPLAIALTVSGISSGPPASVVFVVSPIHRHPFAQSSPP